MDEDKLEDAISNPQNLGEMEDADAVGTVGFPECGDMVRLWLKYKEDGEGNTVIDRASFQSFGCQTALAVASVATEMLKGKTPEEARDLDASDLSAPLGALPPMKIHCGQMVEGALRQALDAEADEAAEEAADASGPAADTLFGSLSAGSRPTPSKIKIVPLDDE